MLSVVTNSLSSFAFFHSGFMGEADLDESLGVSMPDDMASWERKEIDACETRDELVGKLKEMNARRADVRDDRRKGMGMDNANNYLDNLQPGFGDDPRFW